MPTTWQRAFVWVADASSVSSELLAQRLTDTGVPAVAIKLHDAPLDGGPAFATCETELSSASWLAPFRDRGIAIGGWGVSRCEPEADAELAVRAVQQFGLAFYIADCELEYKASSGDRGRSARFVRRFRELAPTLPAALSSLPNEPTGDDIDWQPWRDGRFRWLPQCYPNEFPGYPCQWPDDAQAAANRVFPRAFTHPTIGFYGGNRVDPMEYVSRLLAARAKGFTYGFSCFVAEQMTDAEWTATAEAVRRGLALH